MIKRHLHWESRCSFCYIRCLKTSSKTCWTISKALMCYFGNIVCIKPSGSFDPWLPLASDHVNEAKEASANEGKENKVAPISSWALKIPEFPRSRRRHYCTGSHVSIPLKTRRQLFANDVNFLRLSCKWHVYTKFTFLCLHHIGVFILYKQDIT